MIGAANVRFEPVLCNTAWENGPLRSAVLCDFDKLHKLICAHLAPHDSSSVSNAKCSKIVLMN